MSRADSPQSPTRHRTGAGGKSKRKKRPAARHGAAGPSFAWPPHALNMLNEWLLAIRREQPKKFTLRPEAGTREEMAKATAAVSELLRSELYRPLILNSPSPAAARAAARDGKVLVLVLGMGSEIVIEMLGIWKPTTKQPAHGVAWHAGVLKPNRFIVRRPGLLAVTVTMKEPTGRPGANELAEAAWLLYKKIKAANPGERKPWQRVAKALNEQRPGETIAEAGERLRQLVKAWKRRKRARTTTRTPK